MATARDGRYGVALAAVVCGTAYVLVGWREPTLLVTGMALALGGLALTVVRGARAVDAHAPEAAPAPADDDAGGRWLGVLVTVALLAGVARAALELESSWTLGLDLSEGAGLDAMTGHAQTRATLARVATGTALAASLAFLAAAGAAWIRRGSPTEKR